MVFLHFLCLEMYSSKHNSKRTGSAANCLTEVLTHKMMSMKVMQKLHGAIKKNRSCQCNLFGFSVLSRYP